MISQAIQQRRGNNLSGFWSVIFVQHSGRFGILYFNDLVNITENTRTICVTARRTYRKYKKLAEAKSFQWEDKKRF